MPRVDRDSRFPTSGKPSYVEWYRCFEDLGTAELISGTELFDNWDNWKEDVRNRWLFFYRPLRSMVGRPQRRAIDESKTRIALARNQIASAQQKALLWGSFSLGFGLVFSIWLGRLGILFLGLLAGAVIGLDFLRRKILLERQIAQHQTRIDELESEIINLKAQIPKLGDRNAAQESIVRLIQEREKRLLNETLGPGVPEDDLFANIQHEKLPSNNRFGLHCLLVEGWGAVQRSTHRTPYGVEDTGLKRATRELGKRILSWRPGSDGYPIFRLSYLQFIFLLEKNINVSSLFVDLVTDKTFGNRSESFQYGHVTNFTLREVDFENELDHLQAIGLPAKFHFEDVHEMAVAVASGAHFRCAITDQEILDSLNKSIEPETRLKALFDDQWSEPSLSETTSFSKQSANNAEEVRSFKKKHKEIRQESHQKASQELRQELEESMDRLAQESLTAARQAVQEVRRQVENFVQQVDVHQPLDKGGKP